MNVVACVTDCRLTDVRMDVATADGEGALASSVEQCDCPVQYRGSSCERCAEGFYRSRQHGPYLGTCLPCQCHDRAATCDPHTGHCRVCNRHTHTHYLPAYLLTFDPHTGHCRVCNRHTHTLPTCLSADIRLVSEHGRHHLRSSSYRTLAVPRTCTNLGDRSFRLCGTVYRLL